jgi:hypothetical protein
MVCPMPSLWKPVHKSCGRHAHQCLGLVMRKILDIAATITLSTRAAVAGSSRRTLYTGVLCLAMLNPSSAQASQNIDYLKLYAHSRIVSEIQYNCFNKLITKESNWRVDAINPNGKHFGLGQMRNTKYRNLDGYRMIDWSLRYIAHRYSGSSCKAFAHWQKHGWH